MSEIETQELGLVARLLETWPHLPAEVRLQTFRSLAVDDSEDFFLALGPREHASLYHDFNRAERRLWLRFLAPDDGADLIQELPEELRNEALHLIDEKVRREIIALLSYREDEAGGLMSPRFVRVRPDMLVAEAIRYVRQQAITVEQIFYVYALDANQRLKGVMSLRQLFVSAAEKRISEVMEDKVITIPDEMDQEQVSRIFQQHRFIALPVIDRDGRMQGVVTVDDILDVNQEEATEDIQKMGGQEALDAPYPEVTLPAMIKKRGGWLVLLFVGEMFTTTAMHHFEDEVAKAVVLMLFVPLIISSGGNAGSQATTLIIRSLALREIRLSDWWRVLRREIVTGFSLGAILALIGFARITLWGTYDKIWGGNHKMFTDSYFLVAACVASSLIGVVLFGSVVGSMLPFILRKLKLDPASASAPFVATLVDVTGLVIYFSVARVMLSGTLL